MNFSFYNVHTRKSSVLLFVALCFFAFNGCSNQKITEPEVLNLLSKIEVAANNKDVEAIIANLSDQAQIKATMTVGGQTQTFAFNPDQYRDRLKQAFAAKSNYSYSRQHTKVKISPDGKSATANYTITESIIVNGELRRSVGSEVATFVKENGKLAIQSLEANSKQD